MKKGYFLTVVGLVFCLVMSVSPEAYSQPITLKMSATQPLQHPNYLAQQYLETLLNKRVPGKFAITRYGGMTLGADLEVARQVRVGLIQMATNTTTNLSNLSPAMAVCDLPFIFRDAKEAQAVLDGPFGKKLMDTLLPSGLRGVAYIPAAFRQIFNSKRAVHAMEDIKGLKLRTAQSKIDMVAAEVIGAAPTPMGFAEVYSGIQQGVVEGVLIPALLGHGMRFHEVAPHLAMIDLQCFTLVWFVNNAWFEKLPTDLKKIFMDSVREARDWQIQNTVEQDREIEKKLKAEGTKTTVVSAEAKKPMFKAAEAVWKRFKGEIPEESLVEIEKAKAAVRR